MDQTEKRQLDNQLMTMGLSKLDEPELIHQLAYLIQDHVHFGEVLRACVPEKRVEMYEAMKPYLNFAAMPLYNYLFTGLILPTY